VRYGGVLHGFTNPLAGRNVKTGIAYDADADQRASVAIRYFLEEMFPHKPPPSVAKPMTTKPKPTPPANTIPMKVLKVLEIIDDTNRAPDGYEGGRTFLNLEQLLPKKDAMGRSIRYREWDVNPLRPGVNRGAERLVTGSDGSAYYTDDHYRSFKKIRSSD
jgi:guanyl-specific ribonuclease Sa